MENNPQPLNSNNYFPYVGIIRIRSANRLAWVELFRVPLSLYHKLPYSFHRYYIIIFLKCQSLIFLKGGFASAFSSKKQ